MEDFDINKKIEVFAQQYPAQDLAARELIFGADDEPESIYWLHKGQVRQFIFSETGEELTLHVFEPGSFFPLMSTLKEIPNRHNYETLSESCLYRIPSNEFIKFLKQEPEILYNLSQRLLHGLNGLLLRVESISLHTASKRVASALLYLARHFGESDGESIVFHNHLTHKDIATYTGLARETTSIEIAKLEKLGIVGYKGSKLAIHKMSKLEELLN